MVSVKFVLAMRYPHAVLYVHADRGRDAQRYLHDLQKKVEQGRQSTENRETGGREEHGSSPGTRSTIHATDQSQAHSALEARTLRQETPIHAYYSPPGQPLQVGHNSSLGPSPESSRGSVATFGLDSSFDDGGIDTCTHGTSPSITVNVPSGSQPQSNNMAKLSPHQQHVSSIWPSAFTVASKTINNTCTRRTKRKWSRLTFTQHSNTKHD